MGRSYVPPLLLLSAIWGSSYIAQLIVNRLIATHGPARTMLVNYLLPGFALFYGATILGEPIMGAKIAGLGLILAGVTLASGLIFWGRRPAPAVPEP